LQFRYLWFQVDCAPGGNSVLRSSR
jgi:hypothetical protein